MVDVVASCHGNVGWVMSTMIIHWVAHLGLFILDVWGGGGRVELSVSSSTFLVFEGS